MGGARFFKTALLCVATTVSLIAAGDLTITFKTENKNPMSTSKSTEVQYYSNQYHRTNNDQEKNDTLMDYKKSAMFIIDHKKKTISKLTLDDAVKMTEATASMYDAETREMMKKMLGAGSNDKVAVKKVGKEVILGRNCDKWEISLGKMILKVSADPNLAYPASQEALKIADKMKESVAGGAMPGMDMTKLYEEAAKIKGVHLKSEMQMSVTGMTMRIFSEATKIEQGAIPASRFELPLGYKEEDMGKKMLEEINKSRKKK
ncbi:MAG: DUF4412 domain-containing protein [Holophagales bacterium]|jgi:hypothetical protein|nr:DUF4412 domain-containing protein [Holophagales bacterium]